MKTLIIKTLIFISFNVVGFFTTKAQTDNPVNSNTQATPVPRNIESNFKSAYKNAAAVEWQQSGDRYKVMFTDEKNLHHTLLYDKDGKVITMDSEMDEESVPKTIREYFIKNLPVEEPYRVWRKQDESGKISFYSPVKDAVIFFKEDGTFDRRDERTPEIIDQQ